MIVLHLQLTHPEAETVARILDLIRRSDLVIFKQNRTAVMLTQAEEMVARRIVEMASSQLRQGGFG